MTNAPKFYVMLTKEQLSPDETRQVKLDNRYHVEWSNDSSYTIVCEDEDSKKTFTRHTDVVTGILPLKHKRNNDAFISIGADNTIQVSLNHGVSVNSLTLFEDTIIGVSELPDGVLAVFCADGKLTFWNAKQGKLLSEINADTTDIANICVVFRERVVFTSSEKATSIWTFRGDKIVTLTGIKSSLERAHRLESDNWLIWTEKGYPSLWSAKGDCLQAFSFSIDPDNGYSELADHRLLIKTDAKSVSVFGPDGDLQYQSTQDNDLVASFSDIASIHNSAKVQIAEKPDIEHFTHYRNFFATSNNTFIPHDEIAAQELELPANSEKRKVWDFFFRPDTWQLRTVLKKEVKLARDREALLNEKQKQTKEQLDKLESKLAFNRLMAWVFITLTVIALAVGAFGFQKPSALADIYALADMKVRTSGDMLPILAFWPVAPLAFLSLMFMRRGSGAKKAIKSNQHDSAVQQVLLDAIQGIIGDIKVYRRQLISQLPVLQAGQKELYSGKLISNYIETKLNGELKALAMRECGIVDEDIKFRAHEPIILPSWSLIQDRDKRSQVASKLHFGNEFAVRIIKGGALVSAVQFIQYIFLTTDKIDVFTMYYDFIADKAYGKEANAFFYKDVTNISKREVDRQGWTMNSGLNNSEIAATEIVLSVASGEKISLTILNEDSISKINQHTKENETISPEIEIKRLEQEKQAILEDDSRTQEEKDDELQFVEIQLQDALLGQQAAEVDDVENKAEDAIKNIRSFLRQHKKEPV